MTGKTVFAAIAAAALLAGGLSWWVGRMPAATLEAPAIAPGALFAASFADTSGTAHSLGELGADILVVNFWATWCAPCREEMPAFSRLHSRWKDRGVVFVGLANDDPRKVERFGRELAVSYPLWVGGDAVSELSRRLGNRLGVLPHTVLVDRNGQVLETRVGPYTEATLEAKLQAIATKSK
jgi:thiol-disulfide isomerase/thioredoxin